MRALKYFYSKGDWIWGKYGFYDAFSEGSDWTVPRYLAIDQCTIAPMIENYRSGLLWKLFMSHPDVQAGLTKLDGAAKLKLNFYITIPLPLQGAGGDNQNYII